ncbi:MAG: hypothetical protein CL840_14855 [Crocinitomicaceae bacterium]|jgi:hypothetical protein|nr:hypothetical protein [Crocinitomicaceae bacterium]|tara:strand:+ start:152727 stop:153143 length:417 start_codon:yes stop_codon:yes gene_type:complete
MDDTLNHGQHQVRYTDGKIDRVCIDSYRMDFKHYSDFNVAQGQAGDLCVFLHKRLLKAQEIVGSKAVFSGVTVTGSADQGHGTYFWFNANYGVALKPVEPQSETLKVYLFSNTDDQSLEIEDPIFKPYAFDKAVTDRW